MDAAIRAFKFRGCSDHAAMLRELLTEIVVGLPADIDALVAMPMHWQRRAQRGFNQAEILAAPIRRRLGLPLLRCAHRVKHTPPQSTLEGRARTRSLRDAFKIDGRIDARHVLIVDDVLTTGHTASQLAHALRAAGAQRVSLIVVARA
jgi:ComF family protein